MISVRGQADPAPQLPLTGDCGGLFRAALSLAAEYFTVPRVSTNGRKVILSSPQSNGSHARPAQPGWTSGGERQPDATAGDGHCPAGWHVAGAPATLRLASGLSDHGGRPAAGFDRPGHGAVVPHFASAAWCVGAPGKGLLRGSPRARAGGRRGRRTRRVRGGKRRHPHAAGRSAPPQLQAVDANHLGALAGRPRAGRGDLRRLVPPTDTRARATRCGPACRASACGARTHRAHHQLQVHAAGAVTSPRRRPEPRGAGPGRRSAARSDGRRDGR